MHKLGTILVLFIIFSSIYPDWGNIIESEVNLALQTEYEVDVDSDGTKESDKSEDEASLSNIFLFFQNIKVLVINKKVTSFKKLISSFYQNFYSFLLVSKIERPPDFKLI